MQANDRDSGSIFTTLAATGNPIFGPKNQSPWVIDTSEELLLDFESLITKIGEQMATQAEVTGYIKKNLNYEEVGDSLFKLVYDLGNDRTQLLVVYVGEFGMNVSSPFATTEDVTPKQALNAAKDYGLGIGISGEFYEVKAFVLLADLDESEIHTSFDLVTSIADELEEALVGGDSF